MPAAVVILRSKKDSVRRGRVLFIDAAAEVSREQSQSFLRERHQQRILAAYRAYEDIDGFAAVAAIEEIEAKGHTLAIPQYVSPVSVAGGAPELSVEGAVEAWQETSKASDRAVGDLIGLLRSEVTA